MTAGYAAFQTNLSITAKGNIKEPSRIIQSWTSTSNEDFHTDYYRENIVSATFLDTNKVSNNATESWDVSEDGKGGVKAWVVPTIEDSTKYDLYIGANDGVIANEDSSHLFESFVNLTNIEFNNNFNTSNMINMEYMFTSCYNLLDLDLSSFDTSKVTNMGGLFMGCSSLTELDLSNFKTSNVTIMGAMFSMWNNNDAGRSSGQLKKIDLTGFDTSNVINMYDMFAYNTNLTSIIGLENFNTAKVNIMHGLFNSCSSLTELNLCSFNTSNATNMIGMFSHTTKLQNIYVGGNWTTVNAKTTNMFTNSGISSVTTGQC